MAKTISNAVAVFVFTAILLPLGPPPALAQKSYSTEELEEIFSKEASLTLAGDITVSTWDFTLDGRHVEALLFRPPADGRRPAMLLIPGYKRTAVDYIRIGLVFARAGYVAVAVTQPGFGRSDGPPDWVGPTTITTMRAGLDRLANEDFVDPSKIGVYGFSRGALAASLLATTPGIGLKAVVVCSGLYDFKSTYDSYSDDGLQGRIKGNMRIEAGLTEEAIDARTALDKLDHVSASILVIHGRQDVNAPIEQAEALIEGLLARDKDVEFKIYDEADHGLRGTGYLDVCIEFLDRKLRNEEWRIRGGSCRR